MRVVLDTNILISALIKPEGLEAQTIALAIAQTITVCVSSAVLAEYRDVLSRDKFKSWSLEAEALLARIENAAVQVEPSERIYAAADEDDNRFLECAASSRADYLITGNLKHYPPSLFATRIVNSRQFLTACSL